VSDAGRKTREEITFGIQHAEIAMLSARQFGPFTLTQAEVLRVLDVRALQDQLERNARRPAAAKLRQAMTIYDPGQAPTESGLEEDVLTHLRAAGLPIPERQVHIVLNDGEEPIRVDFVRRAQRLVLETDGRQFHATRRAFETDRRRDQRLARAGWRVVRVTWRQLRDDPASVVALVADLLRG
jgi:very-short-patch-repair endonuclease